MMKEQKQKSERVCGFVSVLMTKKEERESRERNLFGSNGQCERK